MAPGRHSGARHYQVYGDTRGTVVRFFDAQGNVHSEQPMPPGAEFRPAGHLSKLPEGLMARARKRRAKGRLKKALEAEMKANPMMVMPADAPRQFVEYGHADVNRTRKLIDAGAFDRFDTEVTTFGSEREFIRVERTARQRVTTPALDRLDQEVDETRGRVALQTDPF